MEKQEIKRKNKRERGAYKEREERKIKRARTSTIL